MKAFNIINEHAAGIDIGSSSHYVCLIGASGKQEVKEFGCYTNELNKLANWLTENKVTTVAMESTNVYWIPLYEILETKGFDVVLANAKYVKNVPGRKTDVQDCMWLQQLHSCGLLHASFRPEDHICVLRGFMRQRDNLVKGAGIHLQRIQKALMQMNIRLDKAVTDISGETGMKIIEAIIDGERDPVNLAKLRNWRVKKDEAEIAEALLGNYRQEHLFSLAQEHKLYRFYQTMISECDNEIADYYKKINSDKSNDNDDGNRNNSFSLQAELIKMTGVDLAKIPGLDLLSIQTIIAETGVDHSKWPSEKHFTSWLGLSPANKITGGKVLSSRTRKVNNRASSTFRMAAMSAGRSKKSALGAYYRRLKSRIGAPKAITATARKIAVLFYNMLKYGEEYVEKGLEYYEKQYEERTIKNLVERAKSLGFNLVKEVAI